MALDKVRQYSSDGLTPAELDRIEARLRQDGYRLVTKANERELLPGEYLKRQRSSFVYSFASPVTWQVVWTDPQRSARADATQATRTPRQ